MSVIIVPVCWAWGLDAQVPWGLGLSPGELLAGLATLCVPLEGVPGRGHGVEVVVGLLATGGAKVDLLGGVEGP